jgi:DNA-binding response OmpR family regulator
MTKILLIEDERQTVEYMKPSLEKRGWVVAVAFSGQEALDIFGKENPDIVLLDLGLPDINGRDVLKEIKDKAPQVKVVVLSGYNDAETKAEVGKLGADYFLGKPVMPPKLYELLEKIKQEKA